jgi:PAS domain S-box-containing protein
MVEQTPRRTGKGKFYRQWLLIFSPILLLCIGSIVVLLVYQPVETFRLVRFVTVICAIAVLSGIVCWRLAGAILKLKATEKELRRSLLLHEAFMEKTPSGLFVKDRSGRYSYANEAWKRILDALDREVLGRTDYDFFPEPEAYQLLQQDEKVYMAEKLLEFPETMASVKGDEYFQVTKFPLHNSKGQIRAIGAIAANVTEKVRTKEALSEVATRFDTLLDLAPNAIVITDVSGQINQVNKMASKLFGYRYADLLTMNIDGLIAESSKDRHDQYRQKFLKKPVLLVVDESLSVDGVRKNAEVFPVELALSPANTPSGLMIIHIIRDVTAQRQSMAALEETTARLQELNRQLEIERSGLELHVAR